MGRYQQMFPVNHFKRVLNRSALVRCKIVNFEKWKKLVEIDFLLGKFILHLLKISLFKKLRTFFVNIFKHVANDAVGNILPRGSQNFYWTFGSFCKVYYWFRNILLISSKLLLRNFVSTLMVSLYIFECPIMYLRTYMM